MSLLELTSHHYTHTDQSSIWAWAKAVICIYLVALTFAHTQLRVLLWWSVSMCVSMCQCVSVPDFSRTANDFDVKIATNALSYILHALTTVCTCSCHGDRCEH